MKKSLIMTIILFLIVGVFGGVVNAASARINASTSSVNIGDTVRITISVGEKAKMIEFSLNYDKTKFEYVAGSATKGKFNQKFSYVNGEGEADTESVSLTFKAKAAGSTSFAVSNLKVATATQKIPSYPMSNSSVSVTAKVKEDPKPVTPPTNNNNNNSKPSTSKPSTNNNKNNNKKDETPVEEPVEQPVEEPVVEPTVVEPAPNELIKLEDETVKTLKDELTKVMIKAKAVAIEDGTSLRVKKLKDGDADYQARNDMFKDIEGIKTYFDLRLQKTIQTEQDGQMIESEQEVKPNGYVTVFLPIPENYNTERLVAYKMNEDGTYKIIEGQIQGNYYTFTTNSPANYALVEVPEKKTWGQTAMQKINDVLGNVKILHIIIIVLLCIILIETIIIIRLSKQKAKRSK